MHKGCLSKSSKPEKSILLIAKSFRPTRRATIADHSRRLPSQGHQVARTSPFGKCLEQSVPVRETFGGVKILADLVLSVFAGADAGRARTHAHHDPATPPRPQP